MTREEALRKTKGYLTDIIPQEDYAEVEEIVKALEQEPCEDVISRQAVNTLVDELARAISDERCCISRGRSTANIMQDILDLSSVASQSEIVRCSQCKYAEVADSEDSQDGYTCQFHRGSIWFSGSYCSWAERNKE